MKRLKVFLGVVSATHAGGLSSMHGASHGASHGVASHYSTASHYGTAPDIFSHSSPLVDAYKDHMMGCAQDSHWAPFAGGAAVSVHSSRDLFTSYDKYGQAARGEGLADQHGFLRQGAVNRILSSSLQSGRSVAEASANAELAGFNQHISPANPFYGAYDGSSGLSGDSSTLTSGRVVRGYRDGEDRNLLETSNAGILRNVSCRPPSNGFGHVNCTGDKIIGQHYDLSNQVGPHRVNAHFETPGKAQQPVHSAFYDAHARKDKQMLQASAALGHERMERTLFKALQGTRCGGGEVCRFKTPLDAYHDV